MSRKPLLSRRAVLAGLWLAGTSLAGAQTRGGSDQGIGGTGISGGDHGIGGTGIVGVIRRFGSIVVNGERIAYAPDIPVVIDGRPASAGALRLGHVARVVARREGALWTAAHRIEVTSEVVGRIESVRPDGFVLLGQTVLWKGKAEWRRPGSQVAVFGLRRTDGIIVASLVERRSGNDVRLAGRLEAGTDGLRIGGVRVSGADASLAGQRVVVEGRHARGVVQATRAARDDFGALPGVGRVLLEAYVRRVASNTLLVGWGQEMRDGSLFPTTSVVEKRMVLSATFDASRRLQVEAAQPIDVFPGPGGPADRGQLPQTGPDGGAPPTSFRGSGQGGPSAPSPGAGSNPGGGGGPPLGPGGPGGPGGGGPPGGGPGGGRH